MNIQQLQYLLAVDDLRHFARAADRCNVTQPTLSMMIRKLEDELDVRIFDRGKSPVEPTVHGEEIIRRARQILADVDQLYEFVKSIRDEVSGEVQLAIIPTLAPYLLPLFLPTFVDRYPKLKIVIRELVTPDIIHTLKSGEIDIGLLATPLHDPRLVEHPIFHEEFYAYTSNDNKASNKKYLLPKDIDLRKLWLLEEGHCFRNQVFNLCELKARNPESDRLHYQAGSLETLKNLVDHNRGITILPHLATRDLTKSQLKKIRQFAPPRPVREISLVTNVNYARKKVLAALKAEIENCLPDDVGVKKGAMVLDIV
jgi:LysR family hydrogen peroxide-inducible transcriptional activator